MDIRQTIVELIKSNVPVQAHWATVVSVNWQAKTMTIEIDELQYDGVLLGLGSHHVRPEKSSKVLVGVIENKEPAMWLIHAEKVKEQWINGNQYGGVLISKEVKNYFESLESAIAYAFTAVGAGSGASGLNGKEAFEGKMALTTKEKFESKKVKHG